MSYDEVKKLCWETWKEEYNNLCIDRSRKRDQGSYCICNERKTLILYAHLKQNLFD